MSSFSFLFWDPLVLPISTGYVAIHWGSSSHVPRGEWFSSIPQQLSPAAPPIEVGVHYALWVQWLCHVWKHFVARPHVHWLLSCPPPIRSWALGVGQWIHMTHKSWALSQLYSGLWPEMSLHSPSLQREASLTEVESSTDLWVSTNI